MKRVGKPVFFIVVILIAVLTYLSFFGITSYFGDVERTIIKGADDIRWGIDIRGGVDVTFSAPADVSPTQEQMTAAESIIKLRLINQNITDYEVYTDLNNFNIFYVMGVLSACMSVHYVVPNAHGDQRKVLDPLGRYESPHGHWELNSVRTSWKSSQ